MKKTLYVFALLTCAFASSSAIAANVATANLSSYIQKGTITNDLGSSANITKIVYSLGVPGDGIATWQLSSGSGDTSDFLSDPNFYQTETFNALSVAAGSNFQFEGLDIDLIQTLVPLSVTYSVVDKVGSSLANAILSIFWSDGSKGTAKLAQQAWDSPQYLTITGNNVGAVPVPAAFWLFCSAIAGLASFVRSKQVAQA